MEDVDVDALRKSAMQDFSFFDGEEECGLPQNAHLGSATSRNQLTNAGSTNNRVLQKTVVPALQKQYAAELPTESPSSFFNLTASEKQDKFVVTATGTRNTPSSSRYSAAAESQSGLEVVTNAAPSFSPSSSRTATQKDGRERLHGITSSSEVQAEQSSSINTTQTDTEAAASGFDVIAHISAFRRDRKAVYEAAVRTVSATMGSPDPEVGTSKHNNDIIYVPGYWPGEIQVVR